MEQTLEKEFGLILQGCLSNERPEELLLLWRDRIEAMMDKEDIFFLGIYSGKAYMSYPMNLINDVRMLKIFCYLPLEKKMKKTKYEKNNFSLYQQSHSFDIFNLFDMYTYVNGMAPLSNEERFTILKSFSMEEKRFLLNNLYPDFSESDFSVNESFQFKAFEAFVATDENFQDPPVVYTEKAKWDYLCLNGKQFASRCMITSLIILAGFFRTGFLACFMMIFSNIVFLQFGLFFDKLLFNHMYRKLRSKENVDSCRRTWRRLQTYMLPMPTNKFALSLCVEEIKNKKHIEFKFCPDKYDQTLGYYRLGDVQMDEEIVLRQFPNTGIFFWFSVMSDVKITRRRIKINSYLSVEKFTPEFFLIDFLYAKPYATNTLSRILSLSALFELVKLTLEENFPGSKIFVISNGFDISAPNTHTRVKISAVARYSLDKLGIGNSCNKTPRYKTLKETIHKQIVDRIMLCKNDLEEPGTVKAIVPFDAYHQSMERKVVKENKEPRKVRNGLYYQEVNISEYNLIHSGHKNIRHPTVGWISQFLDFEKRTLDLTKFCERKYEGYMRKRLVPLIEKDFDHFSGGATEPVPEFIYLPGEEIEVEKRVRPTEDFPEYAQDGVIHREIEIFPVCATLGMLTAPTEEKLKKAKKPLDEVGKRKRDKIHKKAMERKNNIPEASKRRWGEVEKTLKKQLLDKYISEPEDVDYVAHTALKLVRRRVQSAGNLYTRVDKRSFNEGLKVARARHKKMGKNLKVYSFEFTISKRSTRLLKEKRAKNRDSDKIMQEMSAIEYITPYGATWVRDKVVEETERFKYFLLRRRLTDYGISWKNSDLSNHNTTTNRFYSNNMNIPHRLRNLMRNIIVIHRNQDQR
jgi:hypothetical protein